MGLELPALFGCDLLWTAETSNPDGDEGFSDFFGGDVSLRPTGVSVEAVKQYRKPEETGSGPSRSICTCEKRADGRLKLPRGAFTCRVTVDCWQGVHARVHAQQSFPTPGHTKPLDTNLTVAFGPGVAKVVEGVKDLASERCGYEWPRLWSGCVTVKVGAVTVTCTRANRSAEPFCRMYCNSAY